VLPPPFEHDAGEIEADATLTASIRSAIAVITAINARSLMRFMIFPPALDEFHRDALKASRS
jgi:hypothetical protein